MLDFASHFMNDKDDAQGKRIVSKLNGVYVRSYEFEKPGNIRRRISKRCANSSTRRSGRLW